MAATPALVAAVTLLAASPAVHPGCRLSPALTATRSLFQPADNDPQQVTTVVMHMEVLPDRKAVGLTTLHRGHLRRHDWWNNGETTVYNIFVHINLNGKDNLRDQVIDGI